MITLAADPWSFDGMSGSATFKTDLIITMARDLGIARPRAFYEKLKVFVEEVKEVWKKKTCTEEEKKQCEAQHGEFLEWACSKCEKNPKRENGQ